MSSTGAATLISGHTTPQGQERHYEEPRYVSVQNRNTNKRHATKKTLQRSGLPLKLGGVNTALICVIIAAAVYFTLKSNTESKLTLSIIQKLDEAHSNLEVEWISALELRKSYLFRCERDWMLYEGHCYYFNNQTKKSFDDSKVICACMNSSLVKIEDEAEDHWLMKYLTADTWIGGKYMGGTVNEFTWLDGTPLVYKGWHESQPDGRSGCIPYWNKFGRYAWDDDECYSGRSFVCERNAHKINVIS